MVSFGDLLLLLLHLDSLYCSLFAIFNIAENCNRIRPVCLWLWLWRQEKPWRCVVSIIVVAEKCNQISAVADIHCGFWARAQLEILAYIADFWLALRHKPQDMLVIFWKKWINWNVIAWSGVVSDTILFKGVGTTELFIQMKCGIFLVFKRLCGD